MEELGQNTMLTFDAERGYLALVATLA